MMPSSVKKRTSGNLPSALQLTFNDPSAQWKSISSVFFRYPIPIVELGILWSAKTPHSQAQFVLTICRKRGAEWAAALFHRASAQNIWMLILTGFNELSYKILLYQGPSAELEIGHHRS